MKVLADLDPAVAEVHGFTRYGIDGSTISIVDRGGISRDLPSRVERNSELRGTKHRVASEREVLVADGRNDGRTVVFVPETKGGQTTGHHAAARVVPRSGASRRDARACCRATTVATTASSTGSRRPKASFDDSKLGEIPVQELLIGPISDTADHWRTLTRERSPTCRECADVKGIGIDLVDIERFRRSLERTPSMRDRLFTPIELDYVAPKADPVPSLAARFAAREAVMKALGVGLGAFGFHDVWVERADSGSAVARRDGRGRRPRRRPPGSPRGTCRSPTATTSPPPTSSPSSLEIARERCGIATLTGNFGKSGGRFDGTGGTLPTCSP